MVKWVIGALLAATAWAPMAQAQGPGQDGGWRGRHGGEGEQSAQPQQGRGNQGGYRGSQPQVQAQPQAQPQAQVGVQAQADGGRRGGWNGGARVDMQAQARAQAQAQQNGGWQGRRDWQRPQQQAQPQADAAAQAYRQQNFGARDRNGDGRPDAYNRDRNGDARSEAFNRGGRGYDAGNRQAYRNDGRGYEARGYDGRSDGRWNNGWRRDNRYDWNQYRSYNRNAFRLPRYYAPYGWNYGYRRFSIGVVLSSSLWGQNYWIDDPYDYRLPEAYGPYRWVRYYNDALLIDVRSGVVVDTVYDIFW